MLQGPGGLWGLGVWVGDVISEIMQVVIKNCSEHLRRDQSFRTEELPNLCSPV